MSTLDEHRRINFMRLLTRALEIHGIRRGVIAQRIGQKSEYISHVTNPDPKRRRVINEDMARRIEKAFEKDMYWLDNEHDVIEGAATGGTSADTIATTIKAARDAMNRFKGVTFTQVQEEAIIRIAIESALKAPLTDEQFAIIIEVFFIRYGGKLLDISKYPSS